MFEGKWHLMNNLQLNSIRNYFINSLLKEPLIDNKMDMYIQSITVKLNLLTVMCHNRIYKIKVISNRSYENKLEPVMKNIFPLRYNEMLSLKI